jgi:hypothetical protein
MGEIIKRLAKGKLLDSNIEIELNHPPAAGQDQQIHIQSEKFRFEMDKKDYLKFATSILVAAKNLKHSKGIE